MTEEPYEYEKKFKMANQMFDFHVVRLMVDGTAGGDGLVLATSASLAETYPLKCNGEKVGHMMFIYASDIIGEYIAYIN